MAAHSYILAWRIPWTGVPGGLLSMGSQSRTRLKQLSMMFDVDFKILFIVRKSFLQILVG